MRRIYDPITGGDVTSSVQATLQSGQQLVTSYLYRFMGSQFWAYNPYGTWCSWVFTDAAFPIFVNMMQIDGGPAQQVGTFTHRDFPPAGGLTFLPENMRHDKLSYGIGFQDHPVELTWGYDDSKVYACLTGTALLGILLTGPYEALTPPNLNLKKALLLGAYNDCPFWIHQAVFTDFPSNGGTFLGTTLMFRGYIRKVSATKSLLKLSISSLMDVFQTVQVPTQTITPNNRAIPYIPAASSSVGNTMANPVALSETACQFTVSEVIARDQLRDCWLTFYPAGFAGIAGYVSGYPPAPGWRIMGNDAASGGFITVYFFEPFVLPASIADINLYAQLSTAGTNPGFKYLPPPEVSA